jgi:hypothetical protein
MATNSVITDWWFAIEPLHPCSKKLVYKESNKRIYWFESALADTNQVVVPVVAAIIQSQQREGAAKMQETRYEIAYKA